MVNHKLSKEKRQTLRFMSDLETEIFFTFNDGNIHGKLSYQTVRTDKNGYFIVTDENEVAQLPLHKIGPIYGSFLEVKMDKGELQWH